jgi:hypothetical protein
MSAGRLVSDADSPGREASCGMARPVDADDFRSRKPIAATGDKAPCGASGDEKDDD